MKYGIEKQRLTRKWYQIKYWHALDWMVIVILILAIIRLLCLIYLKF